jgi:hypothetical protein
VKRKERRFFMPFFLFSPSVKETPSFRNFHYFSLAFLFEHLSPRRTRPEITMASLATSPFVRAPVHSCAPRAAIAVSASALPSSRQQQQQRSATFAIGQSTSRRRSVSSLLSSPSRRVVSASRGNAVVARAEISYIMVIGGIG